MIHWVLVVLVLWCEVSHARGKAPSTTDIIQNGLFSVAPSAGYSQSTIRINPSDSAGYSIVMYGLEVDVQLWSWGEGTSRLKAFGRHHQGRGGNTFTSAEKIVVNESLFGIKLYPTNWLYFLGGVGPGSVKLEKASTSFDIVYNFMAAGLGVDMPVSEQWILGLELGYHFGRMRSSTNASVPTGSDYEAAALLLHLRWSPPVAGLISP